MAWTPPLPQRPGRHRLHEPTRRWVHDPALGWLHIPTEEDPVAAFVQDDLTADDRLVAQTEKDAPGDPDADLVQPIQDPLAIPASVVDEFGWPT